MFKKTIKISLIGQKDASAKGTNMYMPCILLT